MHRARGHHRARDRAPTVPGPVAPERAGRPAVRAVAGGHRAVAVPGLRQPTAPSAGSSRTSASRSSSRCRAWSSPRSSCACRSSSARSSRCCGRSAPTRRRRPTRWAPAPWRTFWRVTLPAIRWGIMYGVILTTARSLGEFGAVAIVSGKISGKTDHADHPRPGALRGLRHRRRLHGLDRARRAWRSWCCSACSSTSPGRLRRRRRRRGAAGPVARTRASGRTSTRGGA